MKKVIATILLVAIALAVGYNIGRYNTIHQAHLLDANDTMYLIDFGGDIHEYEYTRHLVPIKEVR